MSPRAGQIISHYRILRKLGAGGMGVVYLAEDSRLRRPVALKFLGAELTRDEDDRKRLIREAQAASALDHPNICSIHEIDETQDGQLFVVMAYYEGETLRDKLSRGPVPLDQALDVVRQVAAGLGRAHESGIVHRDITPANIMVTKAGGVKILDFGLAKLRDQSKVTSTGRTVGTIKYMSPEQARGEEVDGRSDEFSLGVVLYELLANRVPFDGEHETAILYKILNVNPERLAKYKPDISEGLQRIVDKALQKEASARYQTIGEMEEDLRRVAEGLKPVRARLPRRYARVVVPLAVLAAATVALWLAPGARNSLRRLMGAGTPVMHIAVLPFENVGKEAQNQAFCDGLTETVTSQLTQLERFHKALWVIPASEVRERTRERSLSPSEARDRLGVNIAVTGAVQRIGDRFRITLILINLVKKDRPRQVGATTMDSSMDNVSSIQDETMLRLAGMLDVELPQPAKKALEAGGTSVSGAYYMFVQGEGYLRRYERRENIDRAIVMFESAIAQDSLYGLAYVGLGEAYWRKYNETRDPQWIELAKNNSLRALGINNLLSPAHVTLGMILTKEAPKEAVSEFDRALSIDPGNVDAYRGLAAAYAARGDSAEAESTYRRAISMKPGYWGVYYDLGKFYWDRKKYEDASLAFRKIVELSPDNYLGYNGLGVCYIRLGRYKEAAAVLERAIQLEPTQAYRHYMNLSVAYYYERNYLEAARTAQKAINTGGSTNYKNWVNLANAYYWLPQKRQAAIDAYRQAAKFLEVERRAAPHDAVILSTLAGIYAMTGDRQGASALIPEALRLQPDNASVNYIAGCAYEQLGRRAEALGLLAKAMLADSTTIGEVARDPFLRELRADARYSRIVERSRSAARH